MATELTYCTVNGYYYDVESPLTGGTDNVDQFNGWTGAFITFTPRVPAGFVVYVSNLDLGSGNTGSTAIALAPITGRVMGVPAGIGGGSVWSLCAINTTNSTGIELVANSAPVAASLTAQGISSLIYDVSFEQVTFAGLDQYVSNFAFVAPTSATTISITDPGLTRLQYGGTAPAVSLPAGVTTFGASLVSATDLASAQVLLGITGSVDGGTPASAGVGTIDGGTP